MKTMPVDLRQANFQIRFRGYDPDAVHAFLERMADDLEVWVKENAELRAKINTQDKMLMELKRAEATLTATLVTAQKAMEEMKGVAQKEADLIVRQAELRAEEVTGAATQRVNQIQGDIMNLLKQRGLFIERVRAMMQSFEKVLEWEDEKSGGK